VVINGETDEIAIGALTLELVSIQPAGFDEYFNALKPDLPNENHSEDSNPKNSKFLLSRNPWFNEFWEHRFSCSLINSSKCLQYQLNETNWDSKLQFIFDAVYVFAYALHHYFNCTKISCPNVSLTDIDGKKLFQLILEKTYLSKFEREKGKRHLSKRFCDIINDKCIVAKRFHLSMIMKQLLNIIRLVFKKIHQMTRLHL
jgi:hypothetical protein